MAKRTKKTPSNPDPADVIPKSQAEQLETKLAVLPKGTLTITSDEARANAESLLEKVAEARGYVNEIFDPVVKSAHAAHKAALSAKKTAMEPVDKADKAIRAGLKIYLQQQRKRQEEEQRKLEEERKQQEAAEREILEETASKAALEGNKDRAEKLMAQAKRTTSTRRSPRPASAPDTGTTLRTTWDVEISEPDKVPVYYGTQLIRTIDVRALRKIASETDGEAVIPGVKFIKDSSLVRK